MSTDTFFSPARQALRTRILQLINAPAPHSESHTRSLAATFHERDELLLDIARYQVAQVEPYARFVRSFGMDPCEWRTVQDVPALPTDVFRFARVSSAPARQGLPAREFLTSGTTSGARGRHVFHDLSMYDAAAKQAARQALFSQGPTTLLVLAPPEHDAPDSSLSYMLSRFVEWFGAASSAYVWTGQQLDLKALTTRLDHAVHAGTPVALLGTSFAFVHACDAFRANDPHGSRWRLPEGSFIMQTGGFKGRSRELTPSEMVALLVEQYGVEPSRVVAEYGMTELSSQLYETGLFNAAPSSTHADTDTDATPKRGLWAPHWVRVTIVHPETLREVAAGETGLVRIDDAANLDSVAFIQTADLGRMRHGLLELMGRSQDAVPRGCSLGVEEILRPTTRP